MKLTLPLVAAWSGALALLAGGSGNATSTSTPPSHSEPTVQTLLDQRFGTGVLGAVDDRIGTDSEWTATSGAAATLLFEFASYAPYSIFGIYDSNSPDFRLPLFYGYAASGAATTLTVQSLGADGYRFTATTNGVSESALFGSSVFGFYLRTPKDQVYFSDTALNGDGVDHLHAYDVPASSHSNGSAPAGSYLLAWEDLLGGGDRDYQDLVLEVSGFSPGDAVSPAPVPLPAGLWLLGSGLLGLAGLRRRMSTNVR